MDELFKEEAIAIRIFYGKEVELDPFDKNTKLIEFPSLPVKALCSDLIASQASWKLPGININKAKQIIIEKKFESFFLLSQRIRIGDTDYQGWRVNGSLQYRIEDNYLRAYIYSGK